MSALLGNAALDVGNCGTWMTRETASEYIIIISVINIIMTHGVPKRIHDERRETNNNNNNNNNIPSFARVG